MLHALSPCFFARASNSKNIKLSIFLKHGGSSVTLSLSLTVRFLPGGEKNPWDFGQFRGACGTGSGLTEEQWFLGPY